ncbi:hypothetical protein ACIGMX_10605 [Streptomyces aquilus]|uniref:Integral membrane protein n=1 Tax=Streptomyces aquilus TaxID=2548456 RepID=A0A3Q9BYA9_9ACTN|nr:hypothetical protein [Streptomyces aquilus]AZP19908.1 hypothetical protein EJC51_29845 [Streptomyces aquilus]
MPDRSLRLLTLPPQSMQGGERRGVLLRERPASPPDAPSDDKPDTKPGSDRPDAGPNAGSGGSAGDDNPFAPPPEGTPDRPWQPRRPSGDSDDDSGSPWGSQWSDRQPGRSSGGFGDRPGGSGPEGGQGSGGGSGTGMRWDPTDPTQRRARYSLLSGMWAFFFALFSWPYVALLLGALALYWGISALRAKPRPADPDAPAPDTSGSRPQTTAAISGLVTASLAVVLVGAGFTAQLVYSDYYTCTNDALTNQAKQSCSDLLPKELRGILGTS